jgi:small ligand-binding sensory domain FIST
MFWHGHAAHPDWREALASAVAQVEQAGVQGPTLGLVYLTDHYADDAQELLDALRRRWPRVAWTGAVGVGVCATGVEHFDEPALALMLVALPTSSFQVFSGVRPLAMDGAYTALVHADPGTPDLGELIGELSARVRSGYVFGGLASSRGAVLHIADGVRQGALSGVAFAEDVGIVSRVTQGCQPVGPVRLVTACQRNVITSLDGAPAIQALLEDLDIDLDQPHTVMPTLRATLVGLTDSRATALPRSGQFGEETRVRHLIGLDPARGAVAIADTVETGMQLAFCQRDREAARRDLVRVCTEVRDEVESAALAPATPPEGTSGVEALGGGRIAGAVYVSCAGRGGPHFGSPSAELQIVRRALGDVPLVGFFAAGEIGHRHVYGYTGVLTAFRLPAPQEL